MASIPNAGMADFKQVKFGKGRALPSPKGRIIEFYGFDDLEAALSTAIVNAPKAMRAALIELGLFGVAETKTRTPVHYGVLRASIGGDSAAKGAASEGQGETFQLSQTAQTLSIMWGTNVEYGPWIEWGFTMHTRRAVFFPGVGFRMVNPFSYRGAHMFELALERTAQVAPKILQHWAQVALTSGGLQQV